MRQGEEVEKPDEFDEVEGELGEAVGDGGMRCVSVAGITGKEGKFMHILGGETRRREHWCVCSCMVPA